MSDEKKFATIDRIDQPDGSIILTVQQTEPPISGHWTAIVTTDGISDRIIAPSGRSLPIGPMPSSIPADLWYFLSSYLS